ncbi:MAG TPA: hypothetical protein QF838_07025, partial [SAR202 cluster bacterium]|nr:hypothetical protein [SAR202 cluster bacterium]
MKHLTYVIVAGLISLLIACGVNTENVDATDEVSLVKEKAAIADTATSLPPTSTPVTKPTAIPPPTQTVRV